MISNDLEKDQETFNQTAEFQPTITSIPTIKPKPTLSMVAAQEELFLPMEELVDYELMWEGFMNKPVEYGGALNLIASRAVFSPPNKFHIELIFDDVPEIIEIEKNNPNIGGFINLDIDNNILTGNEVDGVDYVLTYFFSGSLESKQIDLHKITKDDFTVFLRKYTRQPRGLNFYVGTNREYTFSFSPHGNALVIEFTLSVINSDTRIQIFPVVNAYDYGYEDLANISTNSDLSKIEMEIINTP